MNRPISPTPEGGREAVEGRERVVREVEQSQVRERHARRKGEEVVVRQLQRDQHLKMPAT